MFSCCSCFCRKDEILVLRKPGVEEDSPLKSGEKISISSNNYQLIIKKLSFYKKTGMSFDFYIEVDGDKRLKDIAHMQAFVDGIRLQAKIATLHRLTLINCAIDNLSIVLLVNGLAFAIPSAIRKIKQIHFPDNDLATDVDFSPLQKKMPRLTLSRSHKTPVTTANPFYGATTLGAAKEVALTPRTAAGRLEEITKAGAGAGTREWR